MRRPERLSAGRANSASTPTGAPRGPWPRRSGSRSARAKSCARTASALRRTGDGLVKATRLPSESTSTKRSFAREHAQGMAPRRCPHVQRPSRLAKPLCQRRERIQIVAVHSLAGFRAHARQVHARRWPRAVFLESARGFPAWVRDRARLHGGKPLANWSMNSAFMRVSCGAVFSNTP